MFRFILLINLFFLFFYKNNYKHKYLKFNEVLILLLNIYSESQDNIKNYDRKKKILRDDTREGLELELFMSVTVDKPRFEDLHNGVASRFKSMEQPLSCCGHSSSHKQCHSDNLPCGNGITLTSLNPIGMLCIFVLYSEQILIFLALEYQFKVFKFIYHMII